jgi:importin subunit beta-1
MAAATCLTLLAQTVADAIVPAVLQFIESNIKAQDWHQREAAVMTFGSILEGPDPDVLKTLVTQALPVLIDMMSDENTHVKDTTAWTLGRVCDMVPEAIRIDEQLHLLISAFVNGLEDKPRIVSNCCWGLMNLADRLGNFYSDGDDANQQASPLTPYFEGVMNALIGLTER